MDDDSSDSVFEKGNDECVNNLSSSSPGKKKKRLDGAASSSPAVPSAISSTFAAAAENNTDGMPDTENGFCEQAMDLLQEDKAHRKGVRGRIQELVEHYLTNNAEIEACDLLIEHELLDMLLELAKQPKYADMNYERICLYLLTLSRVPPENIKLVEVAKELYLNYGKQIEEWNQLKTHGKGMHKRMQELVEHYLTNNAEIEACDLLIEHELLDILLELAKQPKYAGMNYERICLHLLSQKQRAKHPPGTVLNITAPPQQQNAAVTALSGITTTTASDAAAKGGEEDQQMEVDGEGMRTAAEEGGGAGEQQQQHQPAVAAGASASSAQSSAIDHDDALNSLVKQAIATLGISLITMGGDIGTQKSLRIFAELTRHGDLAIRRAVPLALALLSTSNPQLTVIETLSKYSHDADMETARNAIFALGVVGAGTKDAYIMEILDKLARFYAGDQNTMMLVRIAQGLVHLGKGTQTLNPFHSDRRLMCPTAVAALLTTCLAFIDSEKLILNGHQHYLFFTLVAAIQPRMLVTVVQDPSDPNRLVQKAFSVRVSQSEDVVAQASNPRALFGPQTRNTPLLLAYGERAEPAYGDFEPLTPILEGIVIGREVFNKDAATMTD